MPSHSNSGRFRRERKSRREEFSRLDFGDEAVGFGGIRESAKSGRRRKRVTVDAFDEKATTAAEATAPVEIGGRSRLVRIVRRSGRRRDVFYLVGHAESVV